MKAEFVILAMSLTLPSLCQTWVKVDSIEIEGEISTYTTDYMSNLYVATTDGKLLRFNPDSRESQIFSVPDIANITLIEAWNPLRPFIFSRDQQEFFYVERFTSSSNIYSLSDLTREYVELATRGTDNSIWIVESPNLQLKKFNESDGTLILEIPIGRLYNIQSLDYLKAYKNLLIASSSDNGIYLFEQFGNMLEHVPEKGISSFIISEDKLVSTVNDQMVVIDLNELKKEALTGPPDYTGLVIIGKRYFFLRNNTIDIYILR